MNFRLKPNHRSSVIRPSISTLLRYLKGELSNDEKVLVDQAIDRYKEYKQIIKGLRYMLDKYGDNTEKVLQQASMRMMSKVKNWHESNLKSTLKFSNFCELTQLFDVSYEPLNYGRLVYTIPSALESLLLKQNQFIYFVDSGLNRLVRMHFTCRSISLRQFLIHMSSNVYCFLSTLLSGKRSHASSTLSVVDQKNS